jgi:hypothetical protein
VPEFVLLYRLPKDYENDAGDVAAWNTWLASLGADLRDVGRPVTDAVTVGAAAPLLRLSGSSLIAAADLGAAAEIASRCPALVSGGAVEVGSVIEMPADHGPEAE